MNDEKSRRLVKRTKTDCNITYAFFIAAFMYLIGLISEFAKGGCSDLQYVSNIVFMTVIMADLFIVTRIFNEVRHSGKPFSHSIVVKLRIMAVLLMIGGAFPSLEREIIDGTEFTNVTIDTQNCLVIILGIIIGMVSEIFVYGSELQEDNDSIA